MNEVMDRALAERRIDGLAGVVGSARSGAALAAAVASTAVVVDQFGSFSLQQTVTYALVLLLIVLSLFVFSGLTGIVSFGHIGFVAVGAYVGGLLTINPALKQSLFSDMPGFLAWVLDVKVGFVGAALAAGLVAALIGGVLSVPIARLDGMAASIATLAFLAIIHTVLLHWDDVTRGSSSVIGVPKETTLTSATVWVCVALVLIAVLQGSRLGLRLRAARSDVAASASCGLDVVRDRRAALILSAFCAGVAGSLFAQFNTTFSPNTLYFDLTFTTIAMLVIGGMRSLAGAVIGVAVVTLVTEVLQNVQDEGFGPIHSLPAGVPQLILALILLAVLIMRPGGIASRRGQGANAS